MVPRKKKAKAVVILICSFCFGFVLGDFRALSVIGINSTLQENLNRINEIVENNRKNDLESKPLLDERRNKAREQQNSTRQVVKITESYTKVIVPISSNGSPEIIRSSFKVQAIEFQNAIIYKGNVKNQIGGKPSHYVTVNERNIIIAQGDGSIIYSKIVEDLKKSNFQSIPSNLDEITSKYLIYDGNRSGFSVKGVLVHANKLYISYTNNVGDVGNPCWNTSILVADFQINFLQFKPFYAPQDCLDQFGSSFSPFESGGAMSVYRDRWLFLSQGAYRNAENPQKPYSVFGSIIRIDLESPTNTRIVAKGLRNSQGFVISDNTLLFTEQGPMGGDEINQLDLLKSKENFPVNFGWPISSYGAHYNLTKETGYPLFKSHSAYGMMEPIRFYTPSIAVSSIVPNPFKLPSEMDSAGYLVGAMGDNLKEGDLSIHYLNYTGRSREYIEDYWSLPINERIRSMINLDDKLLVSTDSGRLLLIEKD